MAAKYSTAVDSYAYIKLKHRLAEKKTGFYPHYYLFLWEALLRLYVRCRGQNAV